MANLEVEIDRLKQAITTILPPTPFPRPGEIPEQIILSPNEQIALDDYQRQLDQVQSRYDLYTEIYLNLTVLGEPANLGGQNQQQAQNPKHPEPVSTNLHQLAQQHGKRAPGTPEGHPQRGPN